MSGVDLAEHLEKVRPDLKVLLMSGCPAQSVASHDTKHFIRKPFLPGDLIEKVKQIAGERPRMERRELEELWRTRFVSTKLRFDTARNHTNAVVRDFPLNDTSPDGRHAYDRAIRLENMALAEYGHVLRIYADLVRYGIVPDESEWLRRKACDGSGSCD